MEHYCFHCMREVKSDASFCPYCGHDCRSSGEAAPYHLKHGTVLINRYLIGEVLGEGGFGITYIGLDQTLSKRVAVKEFYPAGAANRTSVVSDGVIVTQGKEDFFRKGVERFLQEAKNVAAFSAEDGIVDVLDYFQENNTAYIVMEFLEGETLKDRINRRGVFEADELVSLMLPVMKSLHEMHLQGIIHRDISPDNIMLTKSGRLKVMDFGSARFFTGKERDMSVVLKQGFAPEEQYRRNSQQGPFTDVYALCATMYTCITGKVPEDSLDRVKQDDLLPPSRLGVRISPTHEAALMHGLAVDAARRCPDMDVLTREFTGAIHVNATADASRPAAFQGVNYGDSFSKPAQGGSRPRQAYGEPYRGGYSPNEYPQAGYPQQQPQKQKSNAPVVVAIVIAALAVLAALGVLIYWFTSNNNKGGGASSAPNSASSWQWSSHDQTSQTEETSPQESSESSSETSASSQPESSGMTEEERKARLNEISAKFSEDIPHMSESQSGASYDYVKQSNGRIWVGTKGSFHDDETDKIWYFFDENQKLYFVYEHTPETEYRYYVNNDEVFKYTVGDDIDTQTHYVQGDSIMTSSQVQGVVSDAYAALGTVNN